MHRVFALVLIAAALGSVILVGAAFTADELGPRVETLETQVAELRGLHDLNPTPTPTAEPEPTATPEPEPTATPVEEQGCHVPEGADVWHAPTDHDHGTAPPAWADAYSCETFGHPVIFGGDEQTPNENLNKHRAFKGFVAQDDGNQIYFRVHAQSNPMGRAGAYHSFEAYVLDTSGNVSMIQGWLDFGTFPESRDFRTRQGDPDSRPGIFGASDAIGSEQWYSRVGGNASGGQFGGQDNELTGAFNGEWYPDTSITVVGATTFFSFDEDQYVHDMSQWPTTGSMGTNRLAGFHWLESRYGFMHGQTFHATQFGQIVDGPDDPLCSGTTTSYGVEYQNTCLVQTIAPTLSGNISTGLGHNIDCPDCTLPN